jgi:hypothetical protein
MVENVPSNNVATESDAQLPTDSGATFSLENILGDNHDTLEHPGLKQQELDAPATTAEGWDEESANRPTAEGFCVECEGEWVPCRTRRLSDGIVWRSQTSLHRCRVKNAQTITAKCVSPRSIEKVPERSTR